MARKSASRTAPARNATTTLVLPQPSGLPRISANTSANSAPLNVIAPGASRVAPGGAASRRRAHDEADRHEADRHVDEEHPAPADAGRQRSADQRPDRDRR